MSALARACLHFPTHRLPGTADDTNSVSKCKSVLFCEEFLTRAPVVARSVQRLADFWQAWMAEEVTF